MKDKDMKWRSALYLMEQDILEYLAKQEKGYGFRKKQISKSTGIPEDVLTVLLRRLKYEYKIELIMIWDESTGLPNGSGYCIAGYLKTEFN